MGISRMNHAVLYVRDARRQQRFYADVLGFATVVEDPDGARALRFQETTDHAECQEHAATAEIADQVEGRHRLFTRTANGVQSASQGDVVDIMPCRLREWPFLPPSRHAPVD